MAPHGTDGDQLRHRFLGGSQEMNYPISATYIACGERQVFLFTGSLRRQGSIGQPHERWRNGSLPAQGPGTSPFSNS